MTKNIFEKLVECCLQAPSADNHQPFRYHYRNGFLDCFYDDKRVAGRTFAQSDPATLLAAGAAYENLIEAAKALSISLGSTSILDNDDCFFSVQVGEEPRFKEVDLSSHPIFLRHTNRGAFKKDDDLSAELKGLALTDSDSTKVTAITNKGKIRDISRAIQKASKIRFETQEVHEWLGQSIRYGKTKQEKLDGLDIETLGLPPGGGLFMKFVSDWKRMEFLNKLGMSALMAKIDAQPVSQASALIAIAGENSKQGALMAGRTLTKTWGEINCAGLAVQPYYVLSDLEQRLSTGGVPQKLTDEAKDICRSTKEILEITDERLYMVLRVGRAKKNAVRSLRLPINQVLTIEP